MKLHKNKESQSQQAVGYSLSFKMGTNENNHGRLWGIKPILSNKKIIFALMFVFLLIASFVYAQSTATPTGAMSAEEGGKLKTALQEWMTDNKVKLTELQLTNVPSGTTFRADSEKPQLIYPKTTINGVEVTPTIDLTGIPKEGEGVKKVSLILGSNYPTMTIETSQKGVSLDETKFIGVPIIINKERLSMFKGAVDKIGGGIRDDINPVKMLNPDPTGISGVLFGEIAARAKSTTKDPYLVLRGNGIIEQGEGENKKLFVVSPTRESEQEDIYFKPAKSDDKTMSVVFLPTQTNEDGVVTKGFTIQSLDENSGLSIADEKNRYIVRGASISVKEERGKFYEATGGKFEEVIDQASININWGETGSAAVKLGEKGAGGLWSIGKSGFDKLDFGTGAFSGDDKTILEKTPAVRTSTESVFAQPKLEAKPEEAISATEGEEKRVEQTSIGATRGGVSETEETPGEVVKQKTDSETGEKTISTSAGSSRVGPVTEVTATINTKKEPYTIKDWPSATSGNGVIDGQDVINQMYKETGSKKWEIMAAYADSKGIDLNLYAKNRDTPVNMIPTTRVTTVAQVVKQENEKKVAAPAPVTRGIVTAPPTSSGEQTLSEDPLASYNNQLKKATGLNPAVGTKATNYAATGVPPINGIIPASKLPRYGEAETVSWSEVVSQNHNVDELTPFIYGSNAQIASVASRLLFNGKSVSVVSSPGEDKRDSDTRNHQGIDIGAGNIYAPIDGHVLAVTPIDGELFVSIGHGNNKVGEPVTRYIHMSNVNVKVGQSISRGTKIGYSPRLHFEIGPRKNNEASFGNRDVYVRLLD
ncbi:MAG TPA: M23 family metallopeptidase [Candidatus Nanoarchaeia archaeon]|nr:M23 family metallopeptidase [Candidatus Nanoarchaeia archaeon]